MQPPQELTDAQYLVVNHIANGRSIAEAERLAEVNRNSTVIWRREIPTFASLLDQALAERALRFREQAEALQGKALKVLSEIMDNEEASPSVRLRAALAIFKLAPAPAAPEEVPQSAQPAQSAPAKTEIVHNSAQQPVRLPAEPGRNSQCPCGSGVKYKRCCANPSSPQTAPAAA
jgi:hypothetical protein